MEKFHQLDTEQINPRTRHIDEQDTEGIVRLINQEDQLVALAVEQEIPHIVQAVDIIYEHVVAGGRLIYIGAGTSGRLGVLDASECPPTYGVPPTMVVGLIAGGVPALTQSSEGVEDHPECGVRDLKHIGFSATDVLVGIAASGRTPYVMGAMQYAKELGAPTIAVTCCQHSALSIVADVTVAPLVGPEAVTGSTRMKSGTAQKMVLNIFSTALMIKMGKVYGNLMVDVQASNGKLINRAVRIVCAATECDEATAQEALAQCGYHCKPAIVMLLTRLSAQEAQEALEQSNGRIALAIKS